MGTYLVRRQAWYQAMVDLNKELKLPDLILAEQRPHQCRDHRQHAAVDTLCNPR